jgi:hypothetical protein
MTSTSRSSASKGSFGRENRVDGVEGGFVDDTFLEQAFELLLLGLASQLFR